MQCHKIAMVCNRVVNQANRSMQAMLWRCIMIQNKLKVALQSHFPVPVALQVFCLSPIIYKYYRATATYWYIYSTRTPWWFPLKMVYFLENRAFQPLWLFLCCLSKVGAAGSGCFPSAKVWSGSWTGNTAQSVHALHSCPAPSSRQQTNLSSIKERDRKKKKIHCTKFTSRCGLWIQPSVFCW